MEKLEQVSNLVALGEGAEELLSKVCEEKGTNQEAVQSAVNKLTVLCAYSMEQITNAFAALISYLAEDVTPAVRVLNKQITSVLPIEDVFFMVPPHIRHLAYNHPKARVRKKNWNRMWKIYGRYIRNGTKTDFAEQ